MSLHHHITGQGEPVILIHGLFGSLENVGQLARRLAVRYQVHRVDVRNHGRSFHDDDMSYCAMADDIIGYMAQQNLQRCWLVGHSMGGKIAMQTALNYPHQVSGLVVADIAPAAYLPDRHQSILRGLQAVVDKQPENRRVADALLQPFVPEVAVRQFLLKNWVPVEGELMCRIHFKAICRQYASQICAAIDDSHSPYTGPCLFLRGAQSDYITPEHHAQIAAMFPCSCIKTIASSGHWLHAEQPDACAKTIMDGMNASGVA